MKGMRLFAAMALIACCGGALAQERVKATFVEGTGDRGREGAPMVTDGRKSTKWCIDMPQRMPYYVVLEAEKPIVLSEYTFTTGDDTHSYPDRNPASWMVYGSNDKTTWKLLDEKHSYFRMTDLNEQEYFFPVKTKAEFKYFKFTFLEMQDDTRIQLSEIGLIR